MSSAPSVPPMPPVRRFVCRDCRQVYPQWAARCPSCLSLKGLELSFVAEAASPSEQAPPSSAPSSFHEDSAQQELAVEPMRPRLVIARAPSPEPELADPEEELADVSSLEGPVPITEIGETDFIRDSTGLPPLDYVLGGGLVEASVV